jgi:twitching motility protein PilT
MIPTAAVRNLIREGKTHQILSAMQTGSSSGMQTMDAALRRSCARARSPRSSPRPAPRSPTSCAAS